MLRMTTDLSSNLNIVYNVNLVHSNSRFTLLQKKKKKDNIEQLGVRRGKSKSRKIGKRPIFTK